MVTTPPIAAVAVASPWLSIVTIPAGEAEYVTWLVRSCVDPLTTPVTMYCCVWVGPPAVTISVALAGVIIRDDSDVGPVPPEPPSPVDPPVPVIVLVPPVPVVGAGFAGAK